MKVIILAGNSKKSNEAWIEELKDGLVPYFEDVEAVHYDHWISGEELNLESEKEKVSKILENFDEYAIIAKSVGIVIATHFVKMGSKPKYCVFAGFPLNKEDSGSELEKNLEGYDTPTTFIQNQDERFMTPVELEKKLNEFGINNFEVVVGRGEEHAYTTKEIVEVVKYKN